MRILFFESDITYLCKQTHHQIVMSRIRIYLIALLAFTPLYGHGQQRLTTVEALEKAFESSEHYYYEPTPPSRTLYLPAKDIASADITKRVMLDWNYNSVMNRFVHAFELFRRISSELELENKVDTLGIILKIRPIVKDQLLVRAIPDAAIRKYAEELLQAFIDFDGNDQVDSKFTEAYYSYSKNYEALHVIASQEEIDNFELEFWKWYDKSQFVSDFDRFKDTDLNEKAIENLRKRAENESDIDRKAILTLEYAKYNYYNGSIMLGDIIESRIYTRYLLEIWLAWRTYTQYVFGGLSSMSVIPNNYFDSIRVVCIDTIVRHCLEAEDTNARCILQNLLLCEILHRQAWIMGNGVALFARRLANGMFDKPIK